jgi:tetracycline repressor-like protein
MSSQVSSTPRQGLNARRAETVEKLLVAGAEELRTVGHEALTVRTVASRAGVSPATAYTYFASRNHLFAESPELAAAATIALLGTDPEVERLRLVIGTEFVNRFRDAIGEPVDPRVLETLALAFSGALLQAGMGLMTYTEMGERLDDVVAVILKGHE